MEVETIIVTRHPGLVEWLARKGITGEVKASVTSEEIKGKHVVGALPAHIAQYAAYMTSVDYMCPFEKRGEHFRLHPPWRDAPPQHQRGKKRRGGRQDSPLGP